jgi:tetratricopeptide (TPR) repeat protein
VRSRSAPLARSRSVAPRRAEHLIDAALAGAPNNAAARYSKAQVLRLEGHCEAAIGEYEMAIALNPNGMNAYDMLGLCKPMACAIGDVIPLEERAIRLGPSGPFAGGYYQRIGMAELFQSHVGQAISLFERAHRLRDTAERVDRSGSFVACRCLCAQRRDRTSRG